MMTFATSEEMSRVLQFIDDCLGQHCDISDTLPPTRRLGNCK